MSRTNRYVLPTISDTPTPPALKTRRPTVRAVPLMTALNAEDADSVIAALDALVIGIEGDWGAYDGGAPASHRGVDLVEVLALEDVVGLVESVAPKASPSESEKN